jgi:hypothetical protein
MTGNRQMEGEGVTRVESAGCAMHATSRNASTANRFMTG